MAKGSSDGSRRNIVILVDRSTEAGYNNSVKSKTPQA